MQSATQIQEQTLTFVPKLAGVALVILLAGHWMLGEIDRVHPLAVQHDPAAAAELTRSRSHDGLTPMTIPINPVVVTAFVLALVRAVGVAVRRRRRSTRA